MVGTFFRTFGQLFAPFVLTAVAAAQLGDYNLTITQAAVGAVMAAAGGILAVLGAIKWGPSPDRTQAATRSAVQAAITVVGAIAVNSVADIFILPRVLLPGAIGVVGSFVFTYLSYTGTPAPSTTPSPQVG